jgi:hypothetical protein
MNSKTDTRVLSPGDAMALGDLLTAIGQKRKIRWMDQDGEIRTGELRSLVMGDNNFAMLPWGTDVRDAWVWVTANGFERTVPVAHFVTMLQEGGFVTEDN